MLDRGVVGGGRFTVQNYSKIVGLISEPNSPIFIDEIMRQSVLVTRPEEKLNIVREHLAKCKGESGVGASGLGGC